MGKVLCALIAFIIAHSNFIVASIDLSNINLNDVQQQLPAEFSNPNETLNQARTLIRDKCINIAGEVDGKAAYDEIEKGIMKLGECAMTIVNFTAIQAEIDEASPKGELDVVFNKYCNKRPEALQCIEEFNDKLTPCLDKEEKDNQDVVMRIVRSLLNFICHKGGDQIALFIAEKGPECLESKKDEIQQCLNNTVSIYLPSEGIENVKTLPKFVVAEKQCEDIQRLEKCIVDQLETCTEITPANIVESMFRFIKNETICRNTPSSLRHEGSNGANGPLHGVSVQNVIFTLFFIFFLYFSKMTQ